MKMFAIQTLQDCILKLKDKEGFSEKEKWRELRDNRPFFQEMLKVLFS